MKFDEILMTTLLKRKYGAEYQFRDILQAHHEALREAKIEELGNLFKARKWQFPHNQHEFTDTCDTHKAIEKLKGSKKEETDG